MFILHMDIPGMDIDQVEEALEDIIYEGMDELAETIEWEIRTLAAKGLHDTRQVYLDALTVDVHEDSFQIELDHPLATAVESGSDPFDMKPGFLRGRTTRKLMLTGRLGKNRQPATVPRPAVVPFSQYNPPWWHPGIKARNFITKTVDDVEDIHAPEVFNDIISRVKV